MMYQGPIRFTAVNEFQQSVAWPTEQLRSTAPVSWMMVTAGRSQGDQGAYVFIPFDPPCPLWQHFELALLTLQSIKDHPEDYAAH